MSLVPKESYSIYPLKYTAIYKFTKLVHVIIFICRPWKQKIEAWLSENEKEDKQNEELRRRPRRFQPNRRSLEADSGKFILTSFKILINDFN